MVRMLAYQAPYAAMQVIGAGIVLKSRRLQAMDLGLLVIFVLSAAQFLSKPFVAQLTGGPGASAQEYIGTNYALYSQSFRAVLSAGVGLLMLMILVRDMLIDVTTRSETDLLSGLFNRRGFEDRVEPGLLAGASRGGVPAALVAIDLDKFKQINDTFGHEAGDRVIRGFAQLLRSTAPPRGIIARMGGEEFAVFLPGANLVAARLFAEGARAAFANTSFDGLPDSARFTAGFGVSEYEGSENLSDLRRRADHALYAAKRGGRDRVRTADADLDATPREHSDGDERAKKTAGPVALTGPARQSSRRRCRRSVHFPAFHELVVRARDVRNAQGKLTAIQLGEPGGP